MYKISLNIIVKNEEKFLDECLYSVKNIVDEIILVDTGSTDNTIEIAQKYGAKIFHFDWINNFSAARNFALKKSSGDWILYLDADERLKKPDGQKLLNLILKLKGKVAVSCVVNNIDEVRNSPSKMNYVRLFPNDSRVKFEGAAHEQIIPSLRNLDYKIIKTDIEIIHLGYNVSKDEIKKKAERNLKLLLEDYKANKHSYTAFQIAQSYSLMNREADAAGYFLIALKDENLLKENKATAYRYIAAYEAKRSNWEKASDYISLSLKVDELQPMSFLIAAQIFREIKNYTEAEKFCRKALELNEKYLTSTSVPDYVIMTDEKTILSLGIGISIQGRSKESFNFYYERLTNLLHNKESYLEADFFYYLMNDYEFPLNKINNYVECTNQANLDLIISFLQDYNIADVKVKLIEALLKKYPHKSFLLNLSAIENIKLGNYKLAEELYKRSIKETPGEPSTYFFLTSFFIQTSKLKYALDTVAKAQNIFSSVPEIMNRLEQVKNKILAYSK